MAASRGLCSLRSAVVATLPYILIALYPAAANAQETGSLIDCYYFDGALSANNTKCPNSNTCCNSQATCLSNRLCHNAGNAENLFIRGPCAVKPKSVGVWDDDCAQICKYNESGGVFPRVTLCSDGSLCCDNVKDCCNKGGQLTFLDESGNVVSTKATAPTTSYVPVDGSLERSTVTPSTSTTSTSTSSTSSTSSSSSTSQSASSSTTLSPPASAETSSASDVSTSSSGSDESLGLKVGLGLGIPLAVIVTACVVYLFLRRRNRALAADGAMSQSQPDGSYYNPAGSMAAGMVYTGAQKPPEPQYQYRNPYPVEMGNHNPAELGDGQPRRYEI